MKKNKIDLQVSELSIYLTIEDIQYSVGTDYNSNDDYDGYFCVHKWDEDYTHLIEVDRYALEFLDIMLGSEFWDYPHYLAVGIACYHELNKT